MKKIAKNYYKTTRFLFLYKSFLYRFVTFTTDSEELQDQIIVNALNIKKQEIIDNGYVFSFNKYHQTKIEKKE